MSIRYVCEHCGASMKIKDELAGKKGHCPKCKGEFVIPALSTAGDVDEYSLAQKSGTARPASGAGVAASRDVNDLPDFPASDDSVDGPFLSGPSPAKPVGKNKPESAFDPDDPFASLGDDADSPPARKKAPAPKNDSDDFFGDEPARAPAPAASRKQARPAPEEDEEEWEDFDDDDSSHKSGKRALPGAKGSAATVADDFMRSFSGSGADDLGEADSPKKKKRRIFGGGGEDKGLSEGTFELADLFMFGLTRAVPILLGTVVLIWGVYAMSSRMMGDSLALPPLGQVTGSVTLDGAVVPGATIFFRPIGNNGESTKFSGSIAITDAAGMYRLIYRTDIPGAAVGKHKVEIRAKNAQSQEIVPPNYNIRTELFVEVAGGNNTHDFPLKSGARKP